MEDKCYAGSRLQVAGYQAGTRGSNRGTETKLLSGVGKA